MLVAVTAPTISKTPASAEQGQFVNIKQRYWPGYDPAIQPPLWRHLPPYIEEFDWSRLRTDHEWTSGDVLSLQYMAGTEGKTCSGHAVTVAIMVRNRPDLADFALGAWPADENSHAIILYAMLDLYYGRTQSTRIADLMQRTQAATVREKVTSAATDLAVSLRTDFMLAAYAITGFRNEVMALNAYLALARKIDGDGPPTVAGGILRSISRDEAEHVLVYRDLARHLLEGNEELQERIRNFIGERPQIVGESFCGQRMADQVIAHIFRDAAGREIADRIDRRLAEIPGQEGLKPTSDRVDLALSRL